MAPIPRIPNRQKQNKPIKIGTRDVVDEYGNTLDDILAKSKREQQQTDEKQTKETKKVYQNTNSQQAQEQRGVEYHSAVFTDVEPGGKYIVTLADYDWFVEDSYLYIGYNTEEEFVSLVEKTTLPDKKSFLIAIPDDEELDGAVLESIEVMIKGDGSTMIHLLNVSGSENCVHFDKEQDITDTQKERARTNITAMIDLLNPDVTLDSTQVTTILTKLGLQDVLQDISDLKDKVSGLEDTVADHENRITALENA